jgi:hypothetical protein
VSRPLRRSDEASGPSFERAVEELFELPPEDFVAARDRAARGMREQGDRSGADAVKRLRRPTVAAWALNQLARRNADDVGELLRAGEELRRAQGRAISERGGDELREWAGHRRSLVRRLGEAAQAILEESGRGTDAHREAIMRTLEAASADEEAGELLRKGRLVTEISAAIGFEEVASPFGMEAPRSDAEEPPSASVSQAEREAAEKLSLEATAAREEADRLELEAVEAKARADRLSRETREARDRAGEAARAARRALAAAREAEAAASRASARFQ